MYYLNFGTSGIRPFFFTIPWIPLLLTVLSLVGGIKLLKRYDFSYRKNYLILVIGLITAVLMIGLTLDRVGANARLQHLPPLKPLYRQKYSDSDWIMGQVTATDAASLTLTTPMGKQVQVNYDSSTHTPFGADFKSGDHVRAIGEWNQDGFEAKGLGKGKHSPGSGKRMK